MYTTQILFRVDFFHEAVLSVFFLSSIFERTALQTGWIELNSAEERSCRLLMMFCEKVIVQRCPQRARMKNNNGRNITISKILFILLTSYPFFSKRFPPSCSSLPPSPLARGGESGYFQLITKHEKVSQSSRLLID